MFTILPGDPAQMMLGQNEDSEQIEIHYTNGLTERIESNTICQSLSQKIFNRDQSIGHIIVDLKVSRLLD